MASKRHLAPSMDSLLDITLREILKQPPSFVVTEQKGTGRVLYSRRGGVAVVPRVVRDPGPLLNVISDDPDRASQDRLDGAYELMRQILYVLDLVSPLDFYRWRRSELSEVPASDMIAARDLSRAITNFGKTIARRFDILRHTKQRKAYAEDVLMPAVCGDAKTTAAELKQLITDGPADDVWNMTLGQLKKHAEHGSIPRGIKPAMALSISARPDCLMLDVPLPVEVNGKTILTRLPTLSQRNTALDGNLSSCPNGLPRHFSSTGFPLTNTYEITVPAMFEKVIGLDSKDAGRHLAISEQRGFAKTMIELRGMAVHQAASHEKYVAFTRPKRRRALDQAAIGRSRIAKGCLDARGWPDKEGGGKPRKQAEAWPRADRGPYTEEFDAIARLVAADLIGRRNLPETKLRQNPIRSTFLVNPGRIPKRKKGESNEGYELRLERRRDQRFLNRPDPKTPICGTSADTTLAALMDYAAHLMGSERMPDPPRMWRQCCVSQTKGEIKQAAGSIKTVPRIELLDACRTCDEASQRCRCPQDFFEARFEWRKSDLYKRLNQRLRREFYSNTTTEAQIAMSAGAPVIEKPPIVENDEGEMEELSIEQRISVEAAPAERPVFQGDVLSLLARLGFQVRRLTPELIETWVRLANMTGPQQAQIAETLGVDASTITTRKVKLRSLIGPLVSRTGSTRLAEDLPKESG